MPQTYFEWLSQASPSVQLQQLISGHWIAQAIGVAAELGIADLLADGPRSSDDLAKAAGCQLWCALPAAASVGEPGGFYRGRITAVRADTDGRGAKGRCVRFTRSRAIQTCSDVQWRAWGQLGYSVRTGQPAFEHIFGMDQWEYRARNPEVNAKFNASETSIVTQVANAVASAYDFSGFGSLIDVGGSHGALLIAILRVNPGLRAVLFDQPHVVEGARKPLVAAGLLERCEIVGGDMFEVIPAGGDAYLLSRIIHGWNNDRAVVILANCRRVMDPHSKLLVAEEVIPAGDVPSYGKLTDLNMMVSAGGQERTEAEYRALYAEAGFTLTRVIPTRSRISLIEGMPV